MSDNDLHSSDNIPSPFQIGGHLENSTIWNELQYCFYKIETLISAENTSPQFLKELYELKEHTINIIKVIDELIYTPISTPQKSSNCNLSTGNGNIQNDCAVENLINGTLENPRVEGLEQIAGLWDVKKILKSLVVLPRRQPQLFMNRKAINSVLLFGPPGTGKTQLVHALAFEANARLHCITVGDILTPLVGQSEKNVQILFQHLGNNSAFTILFIDELDGLCKKRTDTEQEHSRRIKTELMCQISKMENNSNLFLICATNCPWDIDSAFLRRFQKRIYIALPTYGERYELFKLFTKTIPLEMESSQWNYLLERTDGYSGSDISHIVQYALNIPIFELDDNKIWKLCSDHFYEPLRKTEEINKEKIVCCELNDLPTCTVRARNIEPIDFINALHSIRTTVSKDELNKFSAFETDL